MKILLSIISIIIIRVEANWKLVYNQEFDGKDTDFFFGSNTENLSDCPKFTGAHYEKSLNGTLAITDPQKDSSERSCIEMFTDINNGFKLGRYEVRLAQPKRQLIWTDIYLWESAKNTKYVKFNIVKYNQQNNIDQEWSVHFEKINDLKTSTTFSLNDFHIYSVEVNETTIVWQMNGQQTWWQNITRILTNKPKFYLRIKFGVGGEPFNNTNDASEEFQESDCPSLLVDYIRYYQWTDEKVVSNITENNITRNEICSQIKLMYN